MKKKIRYIFPVAGLLQLTSPVTAQQLSNPAANTPVPITTGPPAPVIYPTLANMTPGNLDFNYIRSVTPDEPTNDIVTGTISRQSTSYFDGLGRPLQTVLKKAQEESSDIVQPYVYDNTGKEPYKYLPFSTLGNVSDGKFHADVKTQTQAFYGISTEEEPFSKTVFDNSPFNREISQYGPGRSWVGSSRGVLNEYRSNEAQEVRIWAIGNNMTDLPVSNACYPAGSLSVTTVTDEDGKFSITYTDRQGRLVMRKQFLYDNHQAQTAHNGYACTYYVYNDLGRLRYILPPEAINQRTESGNTWSISATVGNGICFAYLYDERGRQVEKKIPGKDVEYFIYDDRDRLALRQDGYMRSLPQVVWQFNLYDALNRPIATGLANSSGAGPRQATLNWFNSYTSNSPSDIYYYLKGYTRYHEYPVMLSQCRIDQFMYYDDYIQLPADMNFKSAPFSIALPANGTVVASKLSSQTQGLPTGSKIRVLDPSNPNSNTWITSANYYDNKGRVIQTCSNNIEGGTDIVSNIYYFQGMLWKTVQTRSNPQATAFHGATTGPLTEYTITDTYEHSVAVGGGNGLVKRHTQQINNGIPYELAQFQYDHLGRNKQKLWTTGNVTSQYNVHGLLERTAFYSYSSYYLDTLFSEALYYNEGFKNMLYNGNIAGVVWTGADHTTRAYGYSYDKLNRLTHAEFNQYTGGSWNKNAGYDFTTSNLSYDQNGNILTMSQMGSIPGASAPIQMDDLTYTYAPGSNSLFNIRDMGVADGRLPDFKDEINHNPASVQEYNYDANGNQTWDLNKGSSTIYNYLNKPEKITVTGKGTITYVYDAAGNRLRKILQEQNGAAETWDYMGPLVYKNNELQYILNDEGRARPVLAGHNDYPLQIPQGEYVTQFVYDYFVKDHLGNVRSTVASKPATQQYMASHNWSMANVENLLFDNINAVRDNKPGSTDPNDMAVRLIGSDPNRRIGTAIMLETSALERIDMSVRAFYDGDYIPGSEVPANSLLESLVQTLAGGKCFTGTSLETYPDMDYNISSMFWNPYLPSQLYSLLNDKNNPNAPKAHLNYLWLNYYTGEADMRYSASAQVPQLPNAWNTLSPQPGGTELNMVNGSFVAPGPGMLIIWLDNMSTTKDVWFDNLNINVYKSEVLEETHYYPFGLTTNVNPMQAGVAGQPYKYNGKELEKSLGLEYYSYGARQYDPQRGQWTGMDPLAEKYYDISPTAYVANNPILYTDPNGKEIVLFSAAIQKNGQLQIGSVKYHNGELYWMNGQKYNGNNPIIMKMANDLNALKKIDSKIEKIINTLDNSDKIHDISNVDPNAPPGRADYKGNYNRELGDGDSNLPLGDKAGSFTKYDPYNKETVSGEKRDPKAGLAHELSHAYDKDTGKGKTGTTSNGIPLDEVDAVNVENRARAKTGDLQRDTYGGDKIPEQNLEKPKR